MSKFSWPIKVIVLFTMFSSMAYAQPKWGNVSPVLLSPIVLEGTELGEIWIRPSHGESSLIVDRQELISSISEIVNDSYLDRLKSLNVHLPYFTQEDVESVGLGIVFDPNDLAIFLNIPLSARKRRELNLGIAPRVSDTIFQSSDSSTYLNVNLKHDYFQDRASQNKAYLDWFGQYKSWVLNHATSYNEYNESQLRRAHTRLIKESAKTMEVFTAGDLRYTTAGFQTFRDGAGLSFSREFSLQPYNITRSIEPYTLILQKPSVVEIYVNGALVHKGFQPAGRLDLLNYPVVTGENEVLVRVEEPSGRVERFVFNRFHHGNLLAPGISEFSYNVFKESYSNKGTLGYRPNVSTSMFYRYGVDTRFTFGANVSTDEDGLMAGVEAKNLVYKAFLESNLAYGKGEASGGLAASFNLLSIPKWKNELSPYNYQLSANLWEKEFYVPGSGRSNRKFKGSARVIKDLAPYLGASLGLENEAFFKEDQINSYTTTLQYRVTSQLRLTLNYKKAFGRDDESYFFTFNWFEKTGKTQVYGAYYEDTKNSQIRATHRFIEGRHNLQGNLGINKLSQNDQDNQDENVQAGLDYDGPLGSLEWTHQSLDKSFQGSLGARFALAMVENKVALGRSIDRGFAIVKTKSKKDYAVPVGKNGVFSQGDANSSGGVLLSNITPYYENNFFINPADIPFNQELSFENFTVIPRGNSGVYVPISIKGILSVSMKINSSKMKVAYKAASVFDKNQSLIRRVFTNEQGETFIENLEPGQYYLVFDDKPGKLKFTVEDGSGIMDLGEFEYETFNN